MSTPTGRSSREGIASELARGIMRHFTRIGLSSLAEVTLANGRRADLLALTPRGEFWIVEIKSSIEDFRTDAKWREYMPFCDRFFFATHLGVPEEIFPQEAGFILADAYGAEILREMDKTTLPAASRKAMLVQFGGVAAARLTATLDPGLSVPGSLTVGGA